MTLEEIYYIGQTIAVVLILVSIIFVGLQVRQNTAATRAALHRDDFSDVERSRIAILNRGLFQKLEGLYFLYKYGSLDKAIWETRLSWAAGCIKLPFYRQWWDSEKTQSIYSGEFVAAIETARDTTNVVPWDVSALQSDGASTREEKPQSEAVKS
jgi:hypothetical protein